MARNLTERQRKFLDVLFEEANGDAVTAKRLAGYSDNTPTVEIIAAIKDEVLERTNLYLARNAPRAAVAMAGAITDPTELGIKEKMNAAREILDRTGLVKTEKVQVEATNGLMILPPKDKDSGGEE
jgi:phage terminase small subunit